MQRFRSCIVLLFGTVPFVLAARAIYVVDDGASGRAVPMRPWVALTVGLVVIVVLGLALAKAADVAVDAYRQAEGTLPRWLGRAIRDGILGVFALAAVGLTMHAAGFLHGLLISWLLAAWVAMASYAAGVWRKKR